MGVGYGAHAADALDDLGGVLGGAVLHHQLHATEAASRNPRVGDAAIRDLHLDAQMTLDAGDRIDNRTCHVRLTS